MTPQSGPSVKWLSPAEYCTLHGLTLETAEKGCGCGLGWRQSRERTSSAFTCTRKQAGLLLSRPFQDVLKGEGGELEAGPLVELVLEFHPVVTGKGKKSRSKCQLEAGRQEPGTEHHGNQVTFEPPPYHAFFLPPLSLRLHTSPTS